MADLPDDAGETDSLPSTLLSAPDEETPINLGAPLVESRQGLERYEFGATLGRGGMGEVRLCRDVVLHRPLAMKVVTSTSPGTVTRFVREARVQGQLEHPGIVPVHDLGLEPGGRPYFTMKRVRGVTLAEVLRGLADGDEAMVAKFPRRRLLQAFQAVCLTVDFAHSRHVLHRDLKPANVMLGDFGEVYVLDWGIAKHLDSAADADAVTSPGEPPATLQGQTAQGAVMGTPGYLSPEQALGEPVDPRTDVFSLGAILFELLTLVPLVRADGVTEALQRTIEGVDARARARAPAADVPPELEAACLKATARDPAERYATARALHDVIDAFLSGERDVQLRSELAERHARAARALAEPAPGAPPAGAEQRRAALRELGQALAIDPGHPGALRTLVKLLGTSRGEVPAEARAELDAAQSRQTRVAGRLGGVAYLSLFLYLPLLLWMGVRDWGLLGVMYGLVLLSAAASWVVGRQPAPRPVAAFLPFVASTALIAWLSVALGPFVFLPSFAATNAIAYAVLLERRHRALALVLGPLGLALPIAAELLGLVPNPLSFSAAGLTIAPQLVELTTVPSLVLLTVSSIGTIVIATLAVAQLRDALREAEEKLVAQSWTLRQLLPPSATAATTGESDLRA